MAEYMDYNEWLEKELKNLQQVLKETREFFVDKCKENTKLQNDLFSEQLEQDETEHYINKLKSTQQELINDVRKYSCKCLDLKDEKNKLSDVLTSKIKHNHIQSLEINELKQELKEYRGF